MIACTPYGSKENYSLMQQAQLLAEQMPDSVLVLLDAVNTALLGDAAKAEYTLLRVQARTNADRDLTTDTEIFQAWEYFVKKNIAEKAALAGFYAAWVAKARNDAAMAIEYDQQALMYAKKTENRLLQGKIQYNIGDLNYDKGWRVEAIARYRMALKIFKDIGNQNQREIMTINAMANAFLVDQQTDSAHFYYSKALEQAQRHDNTALQTMVYTNMGVAYRERKQLDIAAQYCRKALSMANADNEKAYIDKTIAHIFFLQNIIDSAKYYLDRAEPLHQRLNKKYSLASLNHLYYQIEKADKNYFKALEYFERYQQYKEELTDEHDRQILLDLGKKYDTAAMENEYNRKESRWWKIMGITACLTLALAVAFFYAKNENKRKKMALDIAESEKEEILEALQNMQNKRNLEMRTEILDKLGIIKDIALLSKNLKESESLSRFEMLNMINRVTSGYSVEKILDVVNELLPKLTKQLKNNFPDAKLTTTELCVCCLVICGFSNLEIALLLQSNKNTKTVETWKTTIRQKLGVKAYGNILEHLMKKITI
jgi:tetratricopeptide (TPR) repeat protein